MSLEQQATDIIKILEEVGRLKENIEELCYAVFKRKIGGQDIEYSPAKKQAFVTKGKILIAQLKAKIGELP